jgi:hypothetical protein
VSFRWKEKIEKRLEALESIQQRNRPENDLVVSATPESHTVTTQRASPEPLDDRQPLNHDLEASSIQSPTLNLTSNLGAFPASSVRTEKCNESIVASADLISRGVISTEVANECLAYFVEHLNPYLHGILDSKTSLSQLRARSTLLTAAVCVVTSFCSAPERYQACYDAFVGDVSSKLFSPNYTFDDVRALCIGAFWLDDIGPNLCGLGE